MKYNLFAIFVPSRTSFLGGRVKAEARQGNTSSKTALLQQTMTATMAAAAPVALLTTMKMLTPAMKKMLMAASSELNQTVVKTHGGIDLKYKGQKLLLAASFLNIFTYN